MGKTAAETTCGSVHQGRDVGKEVERVSMQRRARSRSSWKALVPSAGHREVIEALDRTLRSRAVLLSSWGRIGGKERSQQELESGATTPGVGGLGVGGLGFWSSLFLLPLPSPPFPPVSPSCR